MESTPPGHWRVNILNVIYFHRRGKNAIIFILQGDDGIDWQYDYMVDKLVIYSSRIRDRLTPRGQSYEKQTRAQLGIIFHNSGHKKFYQAYPTLTQRPSFSCDTQRWGKMVTTLIWKDLINSFAYWGLEIASSVNRE